MRTLQEKYNAVVEGNYSKAEFLRDARMSQPQFITQYNGYDDAVQILKNKGMIAEAKAQEPKYSTAKPEDTIAPDVLDTGIKFELDKKYGTLDVTDEQYAKCREMAIKNLANDVLYYVKQDSIQLATPGEKMEKAKLNEGFFDRFKKKPTAAPAKTPEVLSTTEIQDRIDAEFGSESDLGNTVLDARVYQTISLEKATKEQVQQLVDIAQEMKDPEDKENDLAFLATLPNFEESMVKKTVSELTDDEISKAKAWKEYQEKRGVTSYTIKAAEEDFKKGWEEGKFRDGNYMSEETGPTGIALSQKQMDQLHDKGAVMVQVTVKDSDGSIRTVDYPLSYLGYEKDIDDTEDSDLEEGGYGENPEKFKKADVFYPTKFYIKDLKSGRILNAISTQDSKLISYYETEDDAKEQAEWLGNLKGNKTRFKVLPGTDPEVKALVNKQTSAQNGSGVPGRLQGRPIKEEQQLKELFKKIITKIITE